MVSINRVNISAICTRPGLKQIEVAPPLLSFNVAVQRPPSQLLIGQQSGRMFPNFVDCIVFRQQGRALRQISSKG